MHAEVHDLGTSSYFSVSSLETMPIELPCVRLYTYVGDGRIIAMSKRIKLKCRVFCRVSLGLSDQPG